MQVIPIIPSLKIAQMVFKILKQHLFPAGPNTHW